MQLDPSPWETQMKLKREVPLNTGVPKPQDRSVKKESKECAPSRFCKVKIMKSNNWIAQP